MTTVTICGRKYGLRFDMMTMEAMEEDCGDVGTALDALKSGGLKMKTMTSMISSMVRSAHDVDQSLCDDLSVLRHMSIGEMKRIRPLLYEEIRVGMLTETSEDAYDGDEFLREAEKKSGVAKKP